MRLLIRRGHSLVNDLRFNDGPIHIGRFPRSHVFLPDKSVSRQHAVILTTPKGEWIVQDMKSSNRTVVNGQPITKCALHEGDIIAIADFTIEVHFETEKAPLPAAADTPIELEDTIVGEPVPTSIYKTTRTPDQVLNIPANRLKDLYQLVLELACINDQEKLVSRLADLLLQQFEAYHTWIGIREDNSGPLTCHIGRKKSGDAITLDRIVGESIIKQAIQDSACVLVPDLTDLTHPGDTRLGIIEHVRSAMAVPLLAPSGIYGVLYLDNAVDQPAYSNLDLDYFSLLANQVAAFLERIG